jgi:oxygen-dependent protoporphyrinogen oxidase
VVLAVPAPVADQLHKNAPGDERKFLAASTFRPALKVSCLLERPLSLEGAPGMYGLMTPALEDSVLSLITFEEHKNASRVPAGKGLLMLMPNVSIIPELLQARDEEIIERLTTAASHYLPDLVSTNRESFVHRHRIGLPEATPTALLLHERFAQRQVKTVEYAGDWVMLCLGSEGAIRSGALAASRVLSRLGRC